MGCTVTLLHIQQRGSAGTCWFVGMAACYHL